MSKGNSIANILKTVGIAFIAIAFVGSLIAYLATKNILVAGITLFGGFLSALLFIAIGEIIQILDDIRDSVSLLINDDDDPGTYDD